MQRTAIGLALVWVALLAPVADAHHSYAMYDGSVYKVFTGVIVRIIPNAAHFEMHFVPLNEQRDALVRDDKGQPLVWVAQMESAAQALKDGITRESFPQGTVFSMGIHPRRDGKPAGDRGMSGLFQCAEGHQAGAGQALRFGGWQQSLRRRRDPQGNRCSAPLLTSAGDRVAARLQQPNLVNAARPAYTRALRRIP